jgi:hypothetical protein
MEMYTKYFCLEFFDSFKYVKNEFQIKGTYAPEQKKPCPIDTLNFLCVVQVMISSIPGGIAESSAESSTMKQEKQIVICRR